MFLLAVISATAALVLSVWLIESGGRPLDFPGTFQTIRKNYRLWQLLAVPAVVLIAWGISSASASAGKADKVGGYKQFLNGALISADVHHYTCSRDSGCTRNYDCDPYTVVDSVAYTDSNGNYHPEESHIAYHDCPYATDEYTYTTTATFGFKTDVFTVASHIFDINPREWRSGHGIPSSVARGVPAQWAKARADIAAGDADPVTEPDTYVNYVLASNTTILKAYSADVDAYLSKGLLPEHTQGMLKGHPIQNLWDANKMSFVGFTSPNARLWQSRLMRFNAALGMGLQGDLHMVAISDKLVGAGQSEDYANALKAYWQGPKMGKKALAKNSIMVVMGVNTATNTISWARAKTGMPVGNGEMTTAIEQRLAGKPFDPEAILGKIKAQVVKDDKGNPDIKYQHTNGALENIVFVDFPFARACMMCKKANEKGRASFVYLEADITQPTWAYVMDVMLSILLGAVAGAGMAAISESDNLRSYTPRRGSGY